MEKIGIVICELLKMGAFLNQKNEKRSKAGLNVASVSVHMHRNAIQVGLGLGGQGGQVVTEWIHP